MLYKGVLSLPRASLFLSVSYSHSSDLLLHLPCNDNNCHVPSSPQQFFSLTPRGLFRAKVRGFETLTNDARVVPSLQDSLRQHPPRRKYARAGGERFFLLVAPLSIPLPSAFRRLLPRTFTKGRSFSLPRRYFSPFFLLLFFFSILQSFVPSFFVLLFFSLSLSLFFFSLSLHRRLIETSPVSGVSNCRRRNTA